MSGRTYAYDSQNRLVSSTLGGVTTTLGYDSLGRLYQVTSGASVRRFVYAPGDSGLPEAVSEFNGSGGFIAHHAFGPGPDEPLLWWDGSAGVTLRSLHADERGSIVAVGNGAGGAAAINSYDEFGRPGAGNTGRFQYTGQMWLPEIGVYHYKNRMYDPRLGRFLQPDPIGYAAGPNLYAYVRNDPVNFVDPLGLQRGGTNIMPTDPFLDAQVREIVITLVRPTSVVFENGNPFAMDVGRTSPGIEEGGGSTSETATISKCEADWLKKKLGAVGLPVSGIGDITFKNGWSFGANIYSTGALLRGFGAVTQGNTVYVQPNRFVDFTTPGNVGRYEEVYHTVQFALLGSAHFYTVYGLNSLAAGAQGGDSYGNNLLEETAKTASKALANMYAREKPCP